MQVTILAHLLRLSVVGSAAVVMQLRLREPVTATLALPGFLCGGWKVLALAEVWATGHVVARPATC